MLSRWEFSNEKEARASPLASKLFEIPDIKSVLLGDTYICVTRNVSEVRIGLEIGWS